MSAVHISREQLDAIAAAVRRRGSDVRSAKAEWDMLPPVDRNFWRDDVRQALAAGWVTAP